MNAWSWYWVWWFSVSMVAFLIPETYAIVTKNYADTLSENIWRLEDVAPGAPIGTWTAAHFLIGGLIGLVLIWLFFHFLFGMFA